MNAVKLIPNYSYDDYLHWEGRWELIDGIPFAMSPSPSYLHQFITANIIGEFRNAIKNATCGKCKVIDFIDIKINDNTVIQPDCAIVCNTPKENFLDFPPALVVEVLSKATAIKDRHTKFSLYEKFGVGYYLIVDPEKKSIEIFHLMGSIYQPQQRLSDEMLFKFELHENCHIDVPLENFWD